MKTLIIFLVTFVVAPSFAQTTESQKHGSSTTVKVHQRRDTAFRVIKLNNITPTNQIAFFLNGKFVGPRYSLTRDLMEAIRVVEQDTLIGTKRYTVQVYVKAKSDYRPKLSSLADIKAKYTEFKETPVVFMLDGDIIKFEPDSYFVDENMLLSVIVDKLDDIQIGVIKLLTKTEENIKERNNIILRGKEIVNNKETTLLGNDRTPKIL